MKQVQGLTNLDRLAGYFSQVNSLSETCQSGQYKGKELASALEPFIPKLDYFIAVASCINTIMQTYKTDVDNTNLHSIKHTNLSRELEEFPGRADPASELESQVAAYNQQVQTQSDNKSAPDKLQDILSHYINRKGFQKPKKLIENCEELVIIYRLAREVEDIELDWNQDTNTVYAKDISHYAKPPKIPIKDRLKNIFPKSKYAEYSPRNIRKSLKDNNSALSAILA